MKEVFVLGAGASHASAETPLGKDLVWKIPSLVEEEEQRYLKDLLRLVQLIPKLSKYIPQVKRMLKTGYLESIKIDKEDYIDELMEDLQKEGGSESAKGMTQGSIKESKKLIKRLTITQIVKSSRGNELYRKFGEYLAERSASEVSVISFNFDCLLREEFRQNNHFRKVYFDYLLEFDSIAKNRKRYNEKDGIPLIKLHGSLDWAFNPKTDTIELRYWRIQPDTYYFDNSEIEPYIFLPHQQRGSRAEVLWNGAKEELSHADKITIIGYSFPAYDQEDVFELFKNVNSKATWEVIDSYEKGRQDKGERENEIRNKYNSLFPEIPESKLHVNVEGFEEYVKLMEQGSAKMTGPSMTKNHYARA